MAAQPHQRLHQEFPATRLQFVPSAAAAQRDLVAASSDCLRVWHLTEGGSTFEKLLDAKASPVAPLTSFDWSPHDLQQIITSSTDCSCCLWHLERGAMDARIHAHNHPVHDVAWGAANVFASCSADGSVRIVDTRAPDQATTLYQSPGDPPTPLLRVGWNRQDPRYLAALAAATNSVMILDARRAGQPLTLAQHTAPVNAFSLSPTSAQHICTAGDDSRALIWDLQRPPSAQGSLEPALSYTAAAEVVALQWSAQSPEHIAIAFGTSAQILHV